MSEQKNHLLTLSRRQRQIMDILYRCGECTAEEIREQLPNPPSNSAVRAMLATLKSKDYIKHREQNLRYVYSAAIAPETARETALDRLINTFFDGSSVKAVNALLGMQADKISEEELNQLSDLIQEAKQKDNK